MARRAIAEITNRDRVPIIVGGTGLYLRATLHGLFQGPGRDEDLRGRLERISSEKGPEQLHRILTRLDPDSAARIHHNDRPKVIRAIEVCLLTQQSLSDAFEQGSEEALCGYRILQIGLAPPRKELYERINQRAREMFASGLVDEVQVLLDAGVPSNSWPFGAVGYKQALEVIRSGVDRDEAVAAAAQSTRRYSKRQMTWFRRQEPTTVWLEGFGDEAQIQQAAHRLASK